MAFGMKSDAAATKIVPAASCRSVTSPSAVKPLGTEKRYCTTVPMAPQRMLAKTTRRKPLRNGLDMVKTGREESQWERDVTPVAACRGTDFSVSFGTVFF